MSAGSEQVRRTILMDVGHHNCVTCQRCATTFATVHPACPSCSQEFRYEARLAKVPALVEAARYYVGGWNNYDSDFKRLREALAAYEAAE